MKIFTPVDHRDHKTEELNSELVIVGGGMAGTCCAILAARQGLSVTLIQDRPVLGGNASSEVRLWILGATSHMGNNNRWAREGGIIDELLVENTYRNPDGNALIFDTILLEKVIEDPNIQLLLNTVAFEVIKSDANTIESVNAFCSPNSTLYKVQAPLFVDASGDGIIGFLSGAAFRMGAESKDEFGEKFAPGQEYGELLGHTLYFYSKDIGRPVKFVPPSFALNDITKIPKYKTFNAQDFGCRLWWIEYGGRLDTIYDNEEIKWELWKIVYGVWDYIKNSGNFPEADTLTLEWVGHIPGKRESRRFEGDYMLIQQDIIEQRLHEDAVSVGGWSIDLHPADGVYSDKPSCNQWHARGVYQIPYRCLYSRNIQNLFLAGRIISASHVAFGSTRVQATLAQAAQAVAMGAAHCLKGSLLPRDLLAPDRMAALQRDLQRSGQFIPDVTITDPDDLVHSANIEVSSYLKLGYLPIDGPLLSLNESIAQMLPVVGGAMPKLTFFAEAKTPTTLTVELRTSDRPTNHTPDVVLASREIKLAGGPQEVNLDFEVEIDQLRYVFVTFLKNSNIELRTTEKRISGLVSVANKWNKAVSNYGKQEPPKNIDIGVEAFEFWTPHRRPGGQNLALRIEPPLDVFGIGNIRNGINRPTNGPNIWLADFDDQTPQLRLSWDSPQTIAQIDLSFDTDFDHTMETVLLGHPENVMPFCVKVYRILAGKNVLAEVSDNHQTRNVITLDEPVKTKELLLEVLQTHGNAPKGLFEIRCYAQGQNK